MKYYKKEIIGLIISIILMIFIQPLLIFWLGYFSGWLTKIIIGNTIAEALNAVFQTNHFTPELLPKLGGVLAWISSFFKTVNRAASQN